MYRIQPQATGSLDKQDLLELAKLLIKAGYTARQGREKKKPNANSYVYFIEFWGDKEVRSGSAMDSQPV